MAFLLACRPDFEGERIVLGEESIGSERDFWLQTCSGQAHPARRSSATRIRKQTIETRGAAWTYFSKYTPRARQEELPRLSHHAPLTGSTPSPKAVLRGIRFPLERIQKLSPLSYLSLI